MSYTNMIMYGSVLPSYKNSKTNTNDISQETIKADDPKNIDKINQFGND